MSTLKVFHETFFRDALDYCQIWQWRAKPELRNTYNLTNKIKTTLYLTEEELQEFLRKYGVTAFKDNEKLPFTVILTLTKRPETPLFPNVWKDSRFLTKNRVFSVRI